MKKYNFKFILSSILSVVFISFGIAGSYVIHNTMKHSTISTNSKLGSIEDLKSIQIKDKGLSKIINESQKLVMLVYADTEKGLSQGSGFLYNDKGDVITNAHVVGDALDVNVRLIDSTLYKGTVIGKSPSLDIALIRVPALENRSPLKINKNYKAKIGNEIIAIGSPFGLENTITTGIISAVDRNFTIGQYEYKNMYQITAPIDNGSSGGPLLDKHTGDIIGVNSAKAGDSSIGFSIPINQVIEYVETWSQNPAVNVTKDTSPKASIDDIKEKKYTSEYLVRYFYECINAENYLEAYTILGSDLQSKLTYENFKKNYEEIKTIEVKNIFSKVNKDKSISITAIIKNSYDKVTKEIKINYILDFENNTLKIINYKEIK
ncbi:S1C family serine protease [Clostridium cochlearium]|uniref:Serine protease n=1 Tax=Clostridium cochlearium TaxID=1494 RepID=A0A2X2YDL7_CLOCO|nr:trypsin-like peptidase domain-containing protein [Clostridium cochlearium]MBU5269654.1 S1C family serine protease [Clostridium cochlearium]MCR1971355.1 S1C family serine protease [Clostridium cochlearium]MDU1442996.1 trypsin-like peptidase domain-containing protein [Clostridium cochlearium]NMA57379.1 trypsin-like serine protease [Clostridium cochlearium]NOH17093.1 trypsin-like serine protease [Clostridium cochlearium]